MHVTFVCYSKVRPGKARPMGPSDAPRRVKTLTVLSSSVKRLADWRARGARVAGHTETWSPFSHKTIPRSRGRKVKGRVQKEDSRDGREASYKQIELPLFYQTKGNAENLIYPPPPSSRKMMISNAVCLSVRLSVCLPLCPSSRSSPSFPLNAKEMSFAKLGKQRVRVEKKLSKFATWRPKEERGREGHYTATIHPTHRSEEGRKETQFSTKQMSSFLRCGAAAR